MNKLSSQISVDRALIVLIVNICASTIIITAVALSRMPVLLVTGGIPIIAIGWFFNKRAVLFTAFFLFLAESIYMFNSKVVSGIDLQNVIQHIFVYSFFAAVALVINKMKSMSDKIRSLNDTLLLKNKELQEISVRDNLTNLYNRRYAHEYVFGYASNFVRQLATPEAGKRDPSLNGKVMVVILVDIDNFSRSMIVTDTAWAMRYWFMFPKS